MKLVIDANVLFSALLKDGLTRKLLFHPEVQAFAPAFIAVELVEHERELLSKFSGTVQEFRSLTDLVLSQVALLPDQKLSPYLQAVESLSKDDDDLLYLAAALYSGSDLWSRDRGFAGQRRVKVWSTSELAAFLFKA
jgi:predicted nucleic acid-binding protein